MAALTTTVHTSWSVSVWRVRSVAGLLGWRASIPRLMSAPNATPARVGLLSVLIVLWTLVVLRSVVYVCYEHAFFESDQAIIGLMAKHLIEGRAFPLFYYGQTYMLGVDAWMAAPFFLVFGSSVTTLHLSVLVSNLIAVTLLALGLVRYGGLTPKWTALALLFFAWAPPMTARSLIEPGANVGVFVYVPLLWLLRGRPLWFGATFALGFLHREFTAYALPPIAMAELASGALRDRARVLGWLMAVVAAAGTWQAVQSLKPYADLMGPGTRGQLVGGLAASQLDNLSSRVALDVPELPRRLQTMVGEHLPRLLGVVGTRSTGREVWAWSVALAIVAALVVGARRDLRERRVRSPFGWYLTGVGLIAVLAYAMTRPSGELVQRYILLALLLPTGAVAVAVAGTSRSRYVSAGLAGLLVLWAALSGFGHVALAKEYWPTPPPDNARVLADALETRGITLAEAGYWRAYKITFLTGERVVVASTDVQRIQEYRRRADEAGSRLVRVQETPCPVAGEAVGPWFLCPVP